MVLSGMGDITTQAANDSELQIILDVLRDGLTVYNQQRILDANIDRAARGLPPINTAQIAPQYNIGLSQDTKNLLVIGGLVLAAMFVFNSMSRGRR